MRLLNALKTFYNKISIHWEPQIIIFPTTKHKTNTKPKYDSQMQSKPGLTVEAIKNYVSNMPHVSAGRLDHVRKNIRSTKLRRVLNSILHDSQPTRLTPKLIQHLLEHCATKPNTAIWYKPSDMNLKIHSDASCLSKPTRSRCGGHFSLGAKPVQQYTPNSCTQHYHHNTNNGNICSRS